MQILITILISLFMSWSLAAHSENTSCTPVSEQPGCHVCSGLSPWRYCVDPPSPPKKAHVIYFFHGRGGSELSWKGKPHKLTALVRERWSETKKKPVVVAISFGVGWFLKKEKLAFVSGPVFDLIEKEIGTPRTRSLFGISMGSFNALQLVAHSPVRFRRVALLNSAVAKGLDPHQDEKKMRASAGDLGADPNYLLDISSLFRNSYPTSQDWERAAPESIAANLPRAGAPRFYISSAASDEFGGYGGARAVAEILRKRGFSVEWRPLSGNHSAGDPTSLADFLAD